MELLSGLACMSTSVAASTEVAELGVVFCGSDTAFDTADISIKQESSINVVNDQHFPALLNIMFFFPSQLQVLTPEHI